MLQHIRPICPASAMQSSHSNHRCRPYLELLTGIIFAITSRQICVLNSWFVLVL